MPESVSVIIPVYNCERFIADAVRSVLAQSLSPIEVIVVDDGSSEDIKSVLDGIPDDRIRYVRQLNQGVAVARNTGASHASGDWLAYLDSDDMMLPHALQSKMALAATDPKVVAVGGGCTYVTENGQATGLVERAPNEVTESDLAVFTILPACGSNILCRRSALIQVNGFHPRLTDAEDRDFFRRIAGLGRIVCVTEPTVAVRVHATARPNRDLLQMKYSRSIIRMRISDLTLRRKAHAWDEYTIGWKHWSARRRLAAVMCWMSSFGIHPTRVHSSPSTRRMFPLAERAFPRLIGTLRKLRHT